MKKCYKCKLEKEFIKFHKCMSSNDGLQNCCKDCKKKFYSENRIEYLKQTNEYKLRNRDKIKIKNKIYYQKNKKIRTLYQKLKEAKDVSFKISRRLRNRLYYALRDNYKQGSAVRDLGCSIADLKTYLENMFYPNLETGEIMTWENYGKKWEIDHIKPFCSFDLTNKAHLAEVCHYANLQPLWKSEHVLKTVNDVKTKLTKK